MTRRLRTIRAPQSFLVFTACFLLTTDVRADPLPTNPHALDPDKSCGLYCVSFIHRYFGGAKPTASELARLCPPGPRGTSLFTIRTSLESLGLHTSALRIHVRDLNQLHHPAVLQLKNPNGLDHFIVLIGLLDDARTGLVFSPPSSLKLEPIDRFAAAFSGLAIVVADRPISGTEALDSHGNDRIADAYDVLHLLSFATLLTIAFTAAKWSHRRTPFQAVILLVPLIWCCGCGPEPGSTHFVETRGEQIADFGVISNGQPLQHTFVFRNKTASSITVVGLDKSCQCQLVDLRGTGQSNRAGFEREDGASLGVRRG